MSIVTCLTYAFSHNRFCFLLADPHYNKISHQTPSPICLLTTVFLLHACLVIEWSRSEADLRHAHAPYRGRSRTPDLGLSRRRPSSPGYMDLPSPSRYQRTIYLHTDHAPRPRYDWEGRFACSNCGHHFDRSSGGNLLIYVDLKVLWQSPRGGYVIPGTSGGDVVCMFLCTYFINQNSSLVLNTKSFVFPSLTISVLQCKNL